MWEDNREWTFSLEKVLLWIIGSYFGQKQQLKLKSLNDLLFIIDKQLFASQDRPKMDWSCVNHAVFIRDLYHEAGLAG